MKILTERIRSIISGNSNPAIQTNNHPFDCIKTRKGILRELMISKESRNLIGLISPSLGEGMFLISVLTLESEESAEVVAFQIYEIMEGRFRASARLTVNEIKGVCAFAHNYQLQPSGMKTF